jgi:hypothetical protein
MTEEEALENIEQAIGLWMKDALERNDKIPGDVDVKVSAIEFQIDSLLYHELERYAREYGKSVDAIIASWSVPNSNTTERVTKPRPKAGSAKGLITIADDFDEPLDDFSEYM